MATVNDKMTAIADAIRFYVPITEKLTLDDMASNIKEVYQMGTFEGYSFGYEEGEVAGKTEGHTLGLKEGIEAGKLAERNAFWETYQDGGKRENWQYAFYSTYWTDDTYNPIYPIKVGSTNTNMLYKTRITDTKVPIDIRGTKLNYTFREAGIITIPELIVDETTEINNGFSGASKLENITITGTIAKNATMGACPLSVASVKSIITALKDFTGGSEYSCTLTVKSSAFDNLEAEGSTAEYNGVACTWAELIDNKKWNLVKA